MAGVELMHQAVVRRPVHLHNLVQELLIDPASSAGGQAVVQNVVSEALDAVWKIRKNPHSPEEIQTC